MLGVDSHWSLILSYLSGVTLHIWTIKGYFDSSIPAMDKAAQIDGATPWQTFRYVFLPLAVPILAVVFVLAFIGMVNEYPVASVLLRDDRQHDARGRLAALPLRAALPLGRFRRRGDPVRPADHRRSS